MFENMHFINKAAIYSAEILSYVVRASIEEDGYGVVQKDLPEILSNLLKLEESVDRCRVQVSSEKYQKIYLYNYCYLF
jgi:hypothetical protein